MITMESGTNHDRSSLHVTVVTPSDSKPREFAFSGTETVGAAANDVANAFGLHPTVPSFEVERQELVLDRSKTLAEAGVHDGDRLELVDVGGGV